MCRCKKCMSMNMNVRELPTSTWTRHVLCICGCLCKHMVKVSKHYMRTLFNAVHTHGSLPAELASYTNIMVQAKPKQKEQRL